MLLSCPGCIPSGALSYMLFRWLFPLFGLGFLRRALVSGATTEELKEQLEDKKFKVETGLKKNSSLLIATNNDEEESIF